MDFSDPAQKEKFLSDNLKKPPPLHINRRRYNRYFIQDIPAGGAGKVIEVSKGGLKILKFSDQEVKDKSLNIFHGINADIVWQDRKYIGLKYAGDINVDQLIKKVVRRVRETELNPKRAIPDHALASVTRKDILSSCIMLMGELDSPDTNFTKLRIHIEEISNICGLDSVQEEKAPGELDEGKDTAPEKPADLVGLILHQANAVQTTDGVDITDIDFAIARLGLDTVKKISVDFMRKKIAGLQVSLTGFEQYKSFNILKTEMFKYLANFFSFKDAEGEGGLLLSLETRGIDILMSASGHDLSGYYISPGRIYSEISRRYEIKHFGRDMLEVNRYYFEHTLEMFKDLYDGYILAHLMFNPGFRLSTDIKLDLTKRNLVFSFLAYLSFLAAMFIIERDRESGVALTNLLTRTGMNKNKVIDYLNKVIDETNTVLKDLGLRGNIRSISFHDSTFRLESYLPKDVRYEHLVKTFRNFKGIKRMAVRYEDDSYTHFILNKLLPVNEFGLNSKAFCTIPCANISSNTMYIEDFFFFDLLIFKDIDKLPAPHKKFFEKLWHEFSGLIIVTFSNYSFIDIDNNELFIMLREYIVDFPSYFANNAIYERMLDHTIGYMRPYTGEHEINRENYLKDIFSMNFIKNSELRSYI